MTARPPRGVAVVVDGEPEKFFRGLSDFSPRRRGVDQGPPHVSTAVALGARTRATRLPVVAAIESQGQSVRGPVRARQRMTTPRSRSSCRMRAASAGVDDTDREPCAPNIESRGRRSSRRTRTPTVAGPGRAGARSRTRRDQRGGDDRPEWHAIGRCRSNEGSISFNAAIEVV